MSGCLNDLEKARESWLPEKRKNKPRSSRMAKCKTKQLVAGNNRKFQPGHRTKLGCHCLPRHRMLKESQNAEKCAMNLLVQSIYILLTSYVLIIIFPFSLHTLKLKGLAFTFWWALASITCGCRSFVQDF